MKHFRRIAEGIDVAPILAELETASDLWNQHAERTADPASPHAQVDDVWLRFFPYETLTSPEAFRAEGRCVFYPAWHRLPSLHKITFDLMHAVRAVELGGLLITRIPAGGRVLPHDDRGSWHASHFETKLYLPLKSSARCVNRCVDEEVNMRTGEVWFFNNLVEHEVENSGRQERITVIFCFHAE